MPGKIFISYRRADSAAAALSVSQYLEQAFGRKNVFIDVGMHAGVKFPMVLEQRLQQCKVMLVLIGPGWLDARDEAGRRRLDDPDDWVRIEIAHALRRNITVIPVRVNGAELPTKAQLPEDIRGLLDHQAASMTTAGFRHEMSGLAQDIRSMSSPRRWRRTGLLAAAAVLLLSIGLLVLLKLPELRSSFFHQQTAVTNNGLWTSRPGEWVLFEYNKDGIGFFYQPAAMQRLSDRAVYTVRIPAKPASPAGQDSNNTQPAYEDDQTVVACDKPISALAERTVYNSDGKIISHYKFGDPATVELATPISPGSVLAAAQRLACDERLWKPTFAKQDLVDVKYAFLAPSPNGAGNIYYDQAKPINDDANSQFEVLTFLQYFADRPTSELVAGDSILGFVPVYRTFGQRLRVNCRDRKVLSPKLEYYDAEGNLVMVQLPFPSNPLDPAPGSPYAMLADLVCGLRVAGTYEGVNHAKSTKGGQGDQSITIAVEQNAADLKVVFQTPGGGGEGTGKLEGNRVKAMSLRSTAPACSGTYEASFDFAGDTLNWTFKGQDCAGQMEGQGSAKRTKT